MKWIVNSYIGVSYEANEKELIDHKVFDDYDTARKYYWDYKDIKRKDGVFTELKPCKQEVIS